MAPKTESPKAAPDKTTAAAEKEKEQQEKKDAVKDTRTELGKFVDSLASTMLGQEAWEKLKALFGWGDKSDSGSAELSKEDIEDKKKYVEKLTTTAKKAAEGTIVPWEWLVTQALHEGGFPPSKLAIDGNNLFGVKAFSDWTGEKISLNTQEEVGGRNVTENAAFRKYKSLTECFSYQIKLLTNSRYKGAFEKYQTHKNFTQLAQDVKNAGYATDSSYASKMAGVARSNKLIA